MKENCTCPISFNIAVGVFLVALSIVSWMSLWQITMPLWLNILTLFLGLLLVILNSIRRAEKYDEELTVDQANKIHANEGY